MSEPVIQQLRKDVAELKRGRVTHRTANVTATDAGSSTFTAALPDGQLLSGLPAPTEFLPAAGQAVTLRLEGATPLYEPAGIAGMTASKLTNGTVSADVTVAGRFATALTGARREMNAVGFQAFDSSNNLTINLDGVNNLLTGRLRTAATGRRIDIGASGLLGDIRFYAASGAQTFVRAYTEGDGKEAIQFGVESGINSLWNRINYNSEGWASYQANRHTISFTNQSISGLGTGWFDVREDNPTTGANRSRFTIQPNGAITFNKGVGADLFINETAAGDATNYLRMKIDDDNVLFPWDRQGLGKIQLIKGLESNSTTPGTANVSPKLQFVSAQGFGAILRYAFTTGNGARLEVRNVADSNYERIMASEFPVGSSRSSKVEGRPFEGGALKELMALRPSWYKRRGRDEQEELGLYADEVPAPMRGGLPADGPDGGVALYASLTYTIAAVQELAARVQALETRTAREPATGR